MSIRTIALIGLMIATSFLSIYVGTEQAALIKMSKVASK